VISNELWIMPLSLIFNCLISLHDYAVSVILKPHQGSNFCIVNKHV